MSPCSLVPVVDMFWYFLQIGLSRKYLAWAFLDHKIKFIYLTSCMLYITASIQCILWDQMLQGLVSKT